MFQCVCGLFFLFVLTLIDTETDRHSFVLLFRVFPGWDGVTSWWYSFIYLTPSFFYSLHYVTFNALWTLRKKSFGATTHTQTFLVTFSIYFSFLIGCLLIKCKFVQNKTLILHLVAVFRLIGWIDSSSCSLSATERLFVGWIWIYLFVINCFSANKSHSLWKYFYIRDCTITNCKEKENKYR